MIDPQAESQALAERSLELAEMLDRALPVVDQGPIRTALAESRRLGLEAKHARDDVARRVAAGGEPGCPVGPQPPIRRVPSTRTGQDPDPIMRGRAVVTPELVDYWIHRRDHVGPAIVAAHQDAAAGLAELRPLLAACRGHLSMLRPRGEDEAEGGPVLRAAVAHFTDLRAALASGINDGQSVVSEAADRLGILRGEATAGKLGDQGIDWVQPWVAGRVAAVLQLDGPIDVTAPLPATDYSRSPAFAPVATP